jgi:hypothetical protein
MARFFGRVGYATGPAESVPGVWVEGIVEREYYGDVLQNIRRLQEGPSVNPDLDVQNSISVVADAYAMEHFFAIRYVVWAGVYWTVTSVEVQSPRLLFRLGEVYNGPKA